jgi:hypothetical protein
VSRLATGLLVAGLVLAAFAVAHGQEGDEPEAPANDDAEIVITDEPTRPAEPTVKPYIAIVGGLQYQTIQAGSPDDHREDRGVTIALSRFGVRAQLGRGISLESEFEANAGPHGASAWEGQAALSVRNQLIRIVRNRWTVEAGRITDAASVDFYCDHVTDQLLTDGYTRGSLLASGFNRGNGVQVRWKVIPSLSVGINLNAANPVSTTSSLVVGGTFPPFSRFYFAPYQYVGRDSANFPADEYHFVMFTPSLVFDSERVQGLAAVQMFTVNTNTSSNEDQTIDGYNLRLGVAGRLASGHIRPFANFSMVQNEVVDPNDGSRLSGEIYTGFTFSFGADVNIRERDGVGVQVALVRDQQGVTSRAEQVFVNFGGTYWLGERTALGARAAMYSRCTDAAGMGCVQEGERSLFVTLRTFI